MDDIDHGIQRLRQAADYLFVRESKTRRRIADELKDALTAVSATGGFFGNPRAKSLAMNSIKEAFEMLLDDSSFQSSISKFNDELSEYMFSTKEQLRWTIDKLGHEFDYSQRELLARNSDLQRQLDEAMRMLKMDRLVGDDSVDFSTEDLTIQSSLFFMSASLAGDSLVIPRFVPYEVYVASEDIQLARAVHDTFMHLLSRSGFEPVPSLPVVFSSQRIRGVVKTEPITSEQLERLLVVQEGILRRLAEASVAPIAPSINRKEDAEIEKIIAETEKIKLEADRAGLDKLKTKHEALKAGSEAVKNIIESLDKLSSLLLKAGVAISLLFGHISISNAPKVETTPASANGPVVVTSKSREEEVKLLEEYIQKLKSQEAAREAGLTWPSPR